MELKDDLGQVWTPEHIAHSILDTIGYTADNDDILTQSIMEPSFGAGVFLYETANRLVLCAQRNGIDKHETATLLNDNIHGIEYDTEVYENTVKSLLAYILDTHDIHCSLPNLLNMDALDYRVNTVTPTLDLFSAFTTSRDSEDTDDRNIVNGSGFTARAGFDYVVGNPPYIRVHDMTPDMRAKVKSYAHSTGTSDLYVIFMELGTELLKPTGTLGYTPCSRPC